MCKNHEISCDKVIICTLYSSIFNMLYITGFISPLLMLSWSKFPPEVFFVPESRGWLDLGVRTVTKLFSQHSVPYEFSVESRPKIF